MQLLPRSIQDLIEAFALLPGIGPKTAQRLTFYLLRADKQKAHRLSDAAGKLFNNLQYCAVCSNFTEISECPICLDPQRDKTKICIVSEPLDIVALEKSGQYKGLYHVLHGVLSPLEGIGPEHLTIDALLQRVAAQKAVLKEVIFATNPTLEGEATAMYIAKLLKPYSIHLTRIARGLPVGGDLEYADTMTLVNAIQDRKKFDI